MAPSSSAKKVAKLASRGKGKKVRFSSGTTFPTVLGAVCVAMLALVVYSRASVPGVETGEPQPGTEWVASYAFRVCDEEFALTGSADELTEDASTGDPETVTAGTPNENFIIHYHPQEGGATGRKAKLGVFLDVYGVKLSDTKLELPADQVADGETRVWDTEESSVFDGTNCEGKDPVLKVRVWDDYTSGSFYDAVTDFDNLRLKQNGMVFVIAVVPDDNDFEIPQPDNFCDLEDFGAIGGGDLCSSGTDTTDPTDTTVAPETTVVTDTTGVTETTTG